MSVSRSKEFMSDLVLFVSFRLFAGRSIYYSPCKTALLMYFLSSSIEEEISLSKVERTRNTVCWLVVFGQAHFDSDVPQCYPSVQ